MGNQDSKAKEQRKQQQILYNLSYQREQQILYNFFQQQNQQNQNSKTILQQNNNNRQKVSTTEKYVKKDEQIMKQNEEANYQNFYFYTETLKIPGNQDDEELSLRDIYKFNYDELEKQHTYIQWLFPNFSQSRYNENSYKLGKREAISFRKNEKVGMNMIESYKLILNFFGMQLKDIKTGQLERADNYYERYYLTLLSKNHNHLRIQRILASLSVTGFRKYAIELVKFLEIEIFGEQESNINKKSKRRAPLDHSQIKYSYQQFWLPYGEYQTEEDKYIFFDKCLIDDESELEDNAYLKELNSNQN